MSGEISTSLQLPKRYELLVDRAKEASVSVNEIVEKVEDATNRVEVLLRQVQTGGLGRLEFFLGKSGSGKTTFLETLPKFFNHVVVKKIPRDIPLSDQVSWLRQNRPTTDEPTIAYIEGLDNPQTRLKTGESGRFFDELREFFREPEGRLLLVWPTTFEPKTFELAREADSIGSDSLIDTISGGIYNFTGLPKAAYYDVADITVRSLTGGQSLESFGITREIAKGLLGDSATISRYYSHIENKSNELNAYYRDILKEKVPPRLWLILAGDDNQSLDLTVGKLTQGIHKQVDIDLLCEYLDEPGLDAAYTRTWQRLRSRMPHIMRMLDVRVVELTPSVALAAARAFGESDIQKRLKSQKTGVSVSDAAMEKAAFFRDLIELEVPNILLKPTSEKTRHEYRRLQRDADKYDKVLNHALGEAIRSALKVQGKNYDIVTEKQNMTELSGLKPDILIRGRSDGRPVCLELTWRSTGFEIAGEIEKQQNTLTPGHIRVYLLQKVLKYVEALGLDS